jgi:hypothetical protein
MSAGRARSGSRYLYEPFDAAAARIDANERVFEERWLALERRLTRIERMLDRFEKRLWLAVYGVMGVIVTESILTLVSASQP